MILLVFLGIVGNVFSQNKVSVHITDWAGGVCCSSGVNVQITVTDQDLLTRMDSVVVEGGGYSFLLTDSNFQTNNGSNCFSAFSWSSNGHDEMEYKTHYNNITENNIRYSDYRKKTCTFYYRNGTKKEVEIDLMKDMIAYP